MMTDNLKRFLFRIVWHRWLFDGRGEKMRVVRVKGWRTALVESPWNGRETITPCFSIFGINFD